MAGDSPIDLLRIPLSWTQDNRTSSIAKDSRRVNVIDEMVPNEPMRAVKRPGLVAGVDLGAGLGQGLVTFNGVVYGVVNDHFIVSTSPPITGASGLPWQPENAAPPWAPFATPRFQYGCVVLGDAIYVIAGVTTGQDIGDVWTSSDGVNWRQCTGSAPFGQRFGVTCTVLNGKIYVMGGTDNTGTYYNDVWSSPDGTNWTQEIKEAPWSKRSRMGVVSTSNGIFILGGLDGGTLNSLADIWFSADGQTWARVTATAPWTPRSSMGCVVFNNLIYVIAGLDDTSGNSLNDVWTSLDGVTWTQVSVAAFATPRLGIGCVVYANKLWAIGGGTLTPSYTSDVYSSSSGSGAWTLVTSTPGWTAREEMGCVVFRTPETISAARYESIWVLSGDSGGTGSQDIWVADLDSGIAHSTALSPTTTLQPYQFNSFGTSTQLLIKNQSNMWVYGSGNVVKVTDVGYPKVTVPGVVVLGGFAYVMDPSGLIYNCFLDDPTSWPSLNVIGADYEDDPGVALVKYLNYVVAFGTYTTQFFYDAGLQFGSPLAPYLNANMAVGCADAQSVVHVGATIAWVAQTREKHKQATYFNGFAPTPISTPFIEKFLNAENAGFVGFSCTVKGQLFYAITLVEQAMTWAYSFTTQQWYEWGAGEIGATDNALLPVLAYSYDFNGSQLVLVDGHDGQIYALSDTAYADGATPFTVYIRTRKFDASNNRRKFFGQLNVIGDQNPGTPSILYTDDDYQTYSTPRTVDMSSNRPALFRMGSARRRAFVYTQSDTNPMRVEALEQQYEQGN